MELGSHRELNNPLLLLFLSSVQFSSFQFKMVSMRSEKSICALPRLSLRRFPNVAFEMVPIVGLFDDGPLSSFQGRSSSAFSFHASLPQAIDGVMSQQLFKGTLSL